ncbi:MAG: hypothetical protein PHU06_10650 [Gallionella sp.]|nr:hypothetical protein [Gallionella sp.]MDD4959340.1 hypothetical protein [Gallionella sp.]
MSNIKNSPNWKALPKWKQDSFDKYIKERTPKPPDTLDATQKRLFESAASKITYAITDEGGLSVTFEELTKEELFAIGEDRGLFAFPYPTEVHDALNAASPRGYLGGKFEVSLPIDDGTRSRVLTKERKTILVTQLGYARSNEQSKFAGEKHRIAHEKHEQWRRWQQAAIDENPRFSTFSKTVQAEKLKKKYAISDKVGTISKRLT